MTSPIPDASHRDAISMGMDIMDTGADAIYTLISPRHVLTERKMLMLLRR